MTRRFRFIKLSETVNHVGETFDLIGIVRDFKLPRPTSGEDKCVVITLIDESHQDLGILVTIFGRRFQDLPLVISPGDILIVTRAMIQKYEEVIVAGYHKMYSSFALYSGRDGTDLNHYQASSKFPQRSDQEKGLIRELRRWLVTFLLNRDQHLNFISNIEENQVSSLVGRILYKQQILPGRWILYFWDGTNAPAISIKSRLDDERDNPVKLQLEPQPLPMNVLSTFPRSGTILRVTMGEGGVFMNNNFLEVGQVVNFHKLRCEVKDNLWSGILLLNTKIRYVQEDNPSQFRCQRCNSDQASSVCEQMVGCCIPAPTQITEVGPVGVPFVSLMDALCCPAVGVKFKCIVRVVAAFPWPIKNFVSSEGILRVRLTLEDPTARIHALLCEDDAEYFFNGLRPGDDDLSKEMNLLLGVDPDTELKGNECTLRNPPWAICCLKSSNNTSGSWEFRIFGTKLNFSVDREEL